MKHKHEAAHLLRVGRAGGEFPERIVRAEANCMPVVRLKTIGQYSVVLLETTMQY